MSLFSFAMTYAKNDTNKDVKNFANPLSWLFSTTFFSFYVTELSSLTAVVAFKFAFVA